METRMLRMLVNDSVVETDTWAGSPAIDFLRNGLGLTGVKEGCREGDCGACAVIVGSFRDGRPRYRAMPSCILALGDLHGRHVVTIEGLSQAAPDGITPVMAAFLEENASQCGFCSPGFVVSLTAWLLEGERVDEEGALAAVEGNLCRCTGYASIRRAARRLVALYGSLPADARARIDFLAAAGVVPHSLAAFARGEFAVPAAAPNAAATSAAPPIFVAGGTDFYVRNPDPAPRDDLRLLGGEPGLDRIERLPDGGVLVGAGVTVRDFFSSPETGAVVPGLAAFERRFASVLVRNRATVAGNVANASPVGDLSAMLLALDAVLLIGRPGNDAARECRLKAFYKGYKKTDLSPGELIRAIRLPAGSAARRFNFEKAAKRDNLDIAAVNTAIRLELDGDTIAEAHVSAGGVAATPLVLERTSAFLAGRRADAATAFDAAELARSEVTPISDARGSAEYRRDVLGRLVLAHFAVLFPKEAGADIAAFVAGGGSLP